MGNAMKFLITLLAVVSLAGCATTRGMPSTTCDGWEPIYPAKTDVVPLDPPQPGIGVISDQLAGQILSHNVHGQKTCGWKPPNAPTKK